jgi:hypothetical protein
VALFGKIASLFGKKSVGPPANTQSLIVEVQISQSSDEPMADFVAFEDRVTHRVEESGYGVYDGNEIAIDGSHARLYMYAPNADDMLTLVASSFLKEPVVKDATFLMRYGGYDDPTARELSLSLEQVRKIYGGE